MIDRYSAACVNRVDSFVTVPQAAHDHFHQCSKPRVRTSFDMEYEIPKLQKWYSINPHPNKMQVG